MGSQILAAFRIPQKETYSRDAGMGYKPQHCLRVSPPKCPCPLPGLLTRVAQICGGEGGRIPPLSLPRVQPALISRMKRVFFYVCLPLISTHPLFSRNLAPSLMGTMAPYLPAFCHNFRYPRFRGKQLTQTLFPLSSSSLHPASPLHQYQVNFPTALFQLKNPVSP